MEDLRRIREDKTGEDERVAMGAKNCLISGMLVAEKYTDKSNAEKKRIKDLKRHILNEKRTKLVTIYGDQAYTGDGAFEHVSIKGCEMDKNVTIYGENSLSRSDI